MPEAVVTALVQAGVLGPVLILVAGYVIRRDTAHATEVASLRSELRASQECRVNDAHLVADRIVALVEKQHEVLGDQTKILDRQGMLLQRVADRLEVRA